MLDFEIVDHGAKTQAGAPGANARQVLIAVVRYHAAQVTCPLSTMM